MPMAVRNRRFTADEYHRMGEAGILRDGDRVELIDGEVLAMTPGLVDLTENRVVRYTSPSEGAYQLVESLAPDARIAPGRLPRCFLRPGDLLP